MLLPVFTQAQDIKQVSLQQAIAIAKQQNKQLQLSKLNEQYYAALKTAGVEVPKTQFSAELGQINSKNFDNRFALVQSFAMPAVYNRQRSVLEQEFQSAQLQTTLHQTQVTKLVKLAYLQLQYLEAKH